MKSSSGKQDHEAQDKELAYWNNDWKSWRDESSSDLSDYLLTGLRHKNVLDVGCGNLSHSNVPERAAHFTGIDISKEAIKRGKALLESKGIDANFVIASGEHLPFIDNSFDATSSVETLTLLGHIFHKVIKEMMRVSKKETVFAVTAAKVAPEDDNAGFWLDCSRPPLHKAFFTEKSMRKLLSKLNFEVHVSSMWKGERIVAHIDKSKAPHQR